jgi:hypothetical protein
MPAMLINNIFVIEDLHYTKKETLCSVAISNKEMELKKPLNNNIFSEMKPYIQYRSSFSFLEMFSPLVCVLAASLYVAFDFGLSLCLFGLIVT